MAIIKTDLTNLNATDLTHGTVSDARLPATALNSNVDLTNLSASNLTSGTLPDARFPSVLPAVSGANLTNLPGGATPYGLFSKIENRGSFNFIKGELDITSKIQLLGNLPIPIVKQFAQFADPLSTFAEIKITGPWAEPEWKLLIKPID